MSSGDPLTTPIPTTTANLRGPIVAINDPAPRAFVSSHATIQVHYLVLLAGFARV